jgi:fibronectin type 3 domain-containing protein
VTLKSGTDYTVSYSNNKKPGQASIKVTGKGDYRGTKTSSFVILPKKLTLKSAAARTKAAYLTWKSDKTVSGYELYRSKKKASGYKRIGTISQVDAAACTNTNVSAGTYYYKMRSFVEVDGTRYYGAFSGIKKVKVK